MIKKMFCILLCANIIHAMEKIEIKFNNEKSKFYYVDEKTTIFDLKREIYHTYNLPTKWQIFQFQSNLSCLPDNHSYISNDLKVVDVIKKYNISSINVGIKVPTLPQKSRII